MHPWVRNKRNAARRRAATLRRKRIIPLLWQWYYVSGECPYGRQKWLAEQLHVSQSTISRDIAATLGSDLRRCPKCGHMVHAADLGYVGIKTGGRPRKVALPIEVGEDKAKLQSLGS
jgi:hypothetical protein